MQDKYKKVKVSNEIPIFPLPNVVFFPKTLLPLHIFEERYRRMVADAISGPNRIGMALLKEGWDRDYFGNPAVHTIGCLGDIQHTEELDDGKYNIMLYGVCRVQILRFVQNEPYRIAQVKYLKDIKFNEGFDEDVQAHSFIRMVREYLKAMGVKKHDEFLDFRNQSFESIVNQVATVLDLSILEKQSLLEKDALQDRFDKLRKILQEKLVALNIVKNVKYVPEDPSWN
ncbi:LON peptidase substrate-binding domain-containing protein [bacterium]|nr:LON peptidase substrate-binding domain-containing protein [bacterium]